MTDQLIHDERTPAGLGQVITLTPHELRRESKGALGGGLSVRVPVANIQRFHAVSYQYVDLAGARRGTADQFLIVWTDDRGQTRREKWMVDVTAPSFNALLHGLEQLRPDASLLRVPTNEAHRQLGMTSLGNVQLYTVLGIVGVLVLLGGCGLLAILVAVAATG